MGIILWDKSLEVGHEIIDTQHKALVKIINRLYDTKPNCDEIYPVFMELYRYTLYHFNEEEAIMGGVDYTARNEHKLEHAKFVKTLDTLAEKAKSGEMHIATETFTWLVGWLLGHIAVFDKQLATYIRSH